jgi:hypothetical protein
MTRYNFRVTICTLTAASELHIRYFIPYLVVSSWTITLLWDGDKIWCSFGIESTESLPEELALEFENDSRQTIQGPRVHHMKLHAHQIHASA